MSDLVLLGSGLTASPGNSKTRGIQKVIDLFDVLLNKQEVKYKEKAIAYE